MKTTSLEDRIPFTSRRSQARLLSPLQDFEEVTSQTELRLDPLTKRVAIVGLNLAGKRTVLYNETDEIVLQALVESSRPQCFFCPERVEEVTPRYPEDILRSSRDGRLKRGDCLLFPNLFPLTEFHAVVALGSKHFLALSEFSPELLVDGLGVAVEFVRQASQTSSAPDYWVICGNYLPPGGASIVHPHLQVLGSSLPLTTHAMELDKARAYHAVHGTCYFDDLGLREKELGVRLISSSDTMTWLAPFAPRGNTEVFGVCAEVAHLCDLSDAHIAAIAEGLSRGLSAYASLKYSTFNFCIYAAPQGLDHDTMRVNVSLVSRQSVGENYRCDDYFLQKMLGTEILIDPPEEVAAIVREIAT
jgi:galactose-1-phosphate uridylyltransferase